MNPPPIHPLLQLFQQGYCSAVPELNTLLSGLAHPDSADKQSGWTISRQLLNIRHRLATVEEAVAAVLAIDPAIRTPWLAVMADRSREAGNLDNPQALIQLVSRLGPAAQWVAQTVEETGEGKGSSTAFLVTPFNTPHLNALERQLFGAGVEQNQSLPALTRVLAATAELTRWQATATTHKQALPVMPEMPALTAIETIEQHPENNWCKGRLLVLPQHTSITHATLLSGSLFTPTGHTPLDWACTAPWAFLLTTLVYAQDSWAAEQRGNLLLELPAGQQPNHPSEVQVLVEDADGYEVLCGTLAELVLRVLDALAITLFPTIPDSHELNVLLSPVIHQLLAQQVWDYHEGLSGEQGYYRIHPGFADDCYNITGSKIVGRRGRTLWQTFRRQAEQWRREISHPRPINPPPNNEKDRMSGDKTGELSTVTGPST